MRQGTLRETMGLAANSAFMFIAAFCVTWAVYFIVGGSIIFLSLGSKDGGWLFRLYESVNGLALWLTGTQTRDGQLMIGATFYATMAAAIHSIRCFWRERSRISRIKE